MIIAILFSEGIPMSTERALKESAEETSRTAGVRELLKLLVKAQKAQRLYESKNTVSERLTSELFSRFSSFLGAEGEFQLVVQEFALRCDDEVVYRGEDRNDSLAFLLFRDGVRRLSFHPGLELEELRAFLDCLNRVAVLANDRDDLVTLLWEQELSAIRYFAVEELSESDAYPRLQDQLASGESPSAGAEGSGGDGVSLDLEQPVSTVPVEACRLTDEEIEALQQELAGEGRVPFHQIVGELALELTLLEDSKPQRAELRQNVIDIADRLLEDGELGELVGLEEHLGGLATMVFASERRAQELDAELRAALSAPRRVEKLLEQVELYRAPKPDALSAYLARLGSSVTEKLVPWLGRLSSPAYRRAVTHAVLASEDGGLGAIEAALPTGAPPDDPGLALSHRQQVREILYALSQHPGARALDLLEPMLRARDGQTRRESFLAISRYPEARVETLALEHLNDADAEIRSAALDTLVRRGQAERGLEILERALGDAGFDDRALGEKRRLLSAVAKLAREEALAPFREILLSKGDHWFASQKDKQLAEAVAHGIKSVGTARATALLAECARTGARFVRAACQKELEKTGRPGSA